VSLARKKIVNSKSEQSINLPRSGSHDSCPLAQQKSSASEDSRENANKQNRQNSRARVKCSAMQFISLSRDVCKKTSTREPSGYAISSMQLSSLKRKLCNRIPSKKLIVIADRGGGDHRDFKNCSTFNRKLWSRPLAEPDHEHLPSRVFLP
jgi:hypothetical protein